MKYLMEKLFITLLICGLVLASKRIGNKTLIIQIICWNIIWFNIHKGPKRDYDSRSNALNRRFFLLKHFRHFQKKSFDDFGIKSNKLDNQSEESLDERVAHIELVDLNTFSECWENCAKNNRSEDDFCLKKCISDFEAF